MTSEPNDPTSELFQLRQAQRAVATRELAATDLRRQLADLRRQLADLRRQLADLRRQLAEANSAVAALETELAAARRAVDTANHRGDDLQAELEAHRRRRVVRWADRIASTRIGARLVGSRRAAGETAPQ